MTFLNPERKTNHVSNGILARKLLRGEKLRKKKAFPVEQMKSALNVEAPILSTIMIRERPSVEAAV